MKRPLRVGLVIGILYGRYSQISARSPAPSDFLSSLTIRVYNLAHVPRRTLDRASEMAGQIFAEMGLTVNWISSTSKCPEAYMSDMSGGTPGSRPTPDTRRYLVVRLVRGVPAWLDGRVTGYALPFARQGAH